MELKSAPNHLREREILAKPPIIEAIFEMQWVVLNPGDIPLDEKYKLLAGRYYEKVKHLYPFIEVLPGSTIPDEMNPNIPRYRFRPKKDAYPLVQIGPGVLTVNLDKTNFLSQNKFYETTFQALEYFFQVIDVQIEQIHIHYIDAFDIPDENFQNFLSEKLKTIIFFQPEIFQKTKVLDQPSSFNLEMSYLVESPKGLFKCRLRNGKKSDSEKVILMDTILLSAKKDIPNRNEIQNWFVKADDLIHDWFYEMIRNHKELW